MAYDFASFTLKANKTIDHILGDISLLRTGRAAVQMLDIVSVEAYGTRMKVNELANISVPDPTLIVIAPWDKSVLGSIEKAIASSGLNLQAVVEGQILRIAVPPLTEERRKEMVKLLHQKIEAGRVMMRSVRGEIKKEIDGLRESDGVSEDMIEADLQTLEKKVKESMDKIDRLAADKAKDLMTV